MSTSTPNLGLVKPGYEEWADVGTINDNMDILDGAVSVYDFDALVQKKGGTLVTEFDTPTSGDILETLTATSGVATVATRLTEFDTPGAGQIQVTVTVAGVGIATHVTTFDAPTAGDIQEVIT